MENAKAFEQKLERICEITGASTDSALARILGIKAPSVAAARKRRQVPGGWVERIAEKYRANANWLLFGEGPKFIADIFCRSVKEDSAANEYRHVPVIGMATCHLKGWYNTNPLAITTPVPMPDASDRVFALLAVGYSMVPAGIRPGHVVFCDPDVSPAPGDVIFIERTDGSASLKRLQELTGEWLTVEGWLDPDSSSQQKPYSEKLSLSTVRRLASVLFIRIKA